MVTVRAFKTFGFARTDLIGEFSGFNKKKSVIKKRTTLNIILFRRKSFTIFYLK